jgi:two-component system chemotaxis sensor kinase CheA
VIKPLGKVFAGARFLSGSSILGTGEVALILDMAAMFTYLSDLETHRV